MEARESGLAASFQSNRAQRKNGSANVFLDCIRITLAHNRHGSYQPLDTVCQWIPTSPPFPEDF